MNLIGINWEKASNTINYPSARKSVGIIGEHTAKFIDFMVIHVIGYCFVVTNVTFKICKFKSLKKFQVENKLLKLSELTVIGFRLLEISWVHLQHLFNF